MARILYFVILLTLLATPFSVAAEVNNCIVCHLGFENDLSGPAHKIARDIHYQKGLGCADCHGGDPALTSMLAVRKVKGYRGVPSHLDVPEFCSRCHSDPIYMRQHNPSLPTDQLDKYKTSIHGQRLFGQKDTLVANCASCHRPHEIGDGRMPHSSTYPLNIPQTCGRCHADAGYMAPYSIPTSQLDEFTRSVHGAALLEKKDLGAPACNSCHGNHGAAPPGVASLAAVCGNCHALEAGLFNSSPHKVAFEEGGFPMCETCHSNHLILKPSDSLVGPAEPALCVQCHNADDGTSALKNAEGIAAAIGALRVAHQEARQLLDQAIADGMMTTDEEFRLQEVRQTLIQSRTLVHSVSADSVAAKTHDGLDKAKVVSANSQALIDEYHLRRTGLGIATIFITVLALALYLKIRRLG